MDRVPAICVVVDPSPRSRLTSSKGDSALPRDAGASFAEASTVPTQSGLEAREGEAAPRCPSPWAWCGLELTRRPALTILGSPRPARATLSGDHDEVIRRKA